MAVYVDELQPVFVRTSRWPYGASCHLLADTVEELHAFAKKLGMRPGWFQPHLRYPHYDLTPGKREQALRLGAGSVTAREWIMRRRGKLPDHVNPAVFSAKRLKELRGL